MFQPVGGMDMIGKAFAKQVGDLIRYNAQGHADRAGRTRRHGQLRRHADAPAPPQQASADWCVCTIPLSILSQIEINVGAPMQAAIDAVP